MTPTRWVLALLAVLVVLPACAPQIDAELDVKEDGSADVRIDLAVEVPPMLAELGEGDLTEQLTGDIDEDTAELAELAGVSPDDVTVEVAEREEGFGVAVAVAGVPLERVPAVLGAPPAGDDEAPPIFDELSVTSDGDDYRISGSLAPLRSIMDMAPDALDEAPGEDMDAAFDAMFDEMLGAALGSASMRFSLRLPGRLGDHDADEVTDDGVLVWEAERDAPTPVNATSSTAPRLGLLLGVLAAGAVLVAAGVAVVAALRRRRAAAAPSAPDWQVPPA